MAFNPGRNVGRVSIRVVPDTTGFAEKTRDKLEHVAKNLSSKVRIDGVEIDRAKVKESLERQIGQFQGLDLNAKVAVTVDRAKLSKTKLRKSIQQQFNEMTDIRVLITAQIRNTEQFEKEVKRLTERASRNKVNIAAQANTIAASAQLRYAARDRIVQFFVKVNAVSANKALTTLAALSGARLGWKWLDDLADKMKNLDKNLPAVLGWTTGITSGIAALATTVGGIVGLGQGLFSITPALLVLPGLLINAAGSLTALFVALKNAGTELSPLKDDMNELGEIINTTFWDRARKPIIDLVKNLMPQLRNSFRDLSAGIGDFTANLAASFEKELGGGRLESIFRGIADGWRILGTGAPGFAGAIVSLSQIAATYTPRLAGWFVRQANTFDAWLKAIATDGRLSKWMEDAIDSMYDLWDATTGLAGTFAGLWKGFEKAGSGGLKGFAQTMQTWDKVVNGPRFQKGMEHFMRGSYVAMDRLVDSMKAIGNIFVDLGPQIERFVGASGTFFFGLAEGLANAMNSPAVGAGMDRFSAGLLVGLDKIKPSLQPIADTFGSFLGLLGTLAGTVLPTAVDALSALMPGIDGIVGAVDRVLPGLATSAGKFVDTLAPAVNGLVSSLTPGFEAAMKEMGKAAETLSVPLRNFVDEAAPALAAALDLFVATIGPIAEHLSNVLNFATVVVDALKNIDFLWNDDSVDEIKQGAKDRGGVIGDIFKWADEVDAHFADAFEKSKTPAKKAGGEAGQVYYDAFGFPTDDGFPVPEADWADKPGKTAGKRFWDAFGFSSKDHKFQMPGQWKADVEAEMGRTGLSGGGGMSRALAQGIQGWSPELDAAVRGLGGKVSGKVQDSAEWLKPAGASVMHGFGSALTGALPAATAPLAGLNPAAQAAVAGAGGWLTGSGASAMHSFGAGLTGALPAATAPLAGLNPAAKAAVAGAGGWLTGSGASAMHSFGTGLTGALPNATHPFALLSTKARLAVAGSGTWLTAPGSETIHGFNRGVVAAVPGVSAAFRDVPGRARGAVPNPGGLLWGVGSSIIGGLVNGIWSGASAVANAIRSVAYSAVNAGKVALKINSPSKVFRDEIGASIGEGLVAGIDRSRASVSRAVSGLVDPSDAATTLPFSAARGGVPLGTHRTTNITFVNPVTRDTLADAQEAAELVNAVG